jgi:hypothetical protein
VKPRSHFLVVSLRCVPPTGGGRYLQSRVLDAMQGGGGVNGVPLNKKAKELARARAFKIKGERETRAMRLARAMYEQHGLV